MKKYVAFVALAAAVSFTAVSAQAGDRGRSAQGAISSGGLFNISPSLQTGNLNVLSGIGVLNNPTFLSGNVISGIVKGNNNNVGHGNISGNQNAVGNGHIGNGSFSNMMSTTYNQYSKRW